MKRYYRIFLTVALLGFYIQAHTQVTIGEAVPPQQFSVLELISQQGEPRGFRLPQLTLEQRNQLTTQILALPLEQQVLARGLRIFNLDGYGGRGCIDTWIDAGIGWVSRCGDTPKPIIATCYTDYYDIDTGNFTEITVIVTDDAGNPTDETRTLVFLNFNLGGTAFFSPKQQMAYQSRWKGETYCGITDSGGNRSHLDATVNGGLLQWGRTTMAPALRCNYDFAPAAFFRGIYNAAYYNPITFNRFIWEARPILSAHNYDWITPQQHHLWGNGGIDRTQGAGNEKPAHPYRNDDFDPCPEGWRVPTQHEWAMLGTDRGGALGTANDVISIRIDGTGNASGLAWIPVANGRASTNWLNNQETADNNFGSMNGIAIYYLSDWQNTELWTWTWTSTTQCPVYDTPIEHTYTHDGATLSFEQRDLTHELAPEPLMFLPASGYRNAFAPQQPEVRNTGAMGHYWSSTIR